VVFDGTHIHYAESRSGHDHIVLFRDIERALEMAPGASPNSDPTGAVAFIILI
jgi:hypothetical protein